MRSVLLSCVALLLLGCGDPPSVAFDRTARFAVRTADGVTTKPTGTVLIAAKAGETSIVDAPADQAPPGTVSGRHQFPAGVTAPAIVAYYEGLLRNAGWEEKDVRVERPEGRLRFVGVTALGVRSGDPEIEAGFQPDGS
jgi:hypothetical protein